MTADVVLPGKEVPVHRGLIAHTARGRNPDFYGGPDGSYEVITVQVAFRPGPQVTEIVSRYINFPINAPVANANILEALRTKYGKETMLDENTNTLSWLYDSSGKLLNGTPDIDKTNCMSLGNRIQVRKIGGARTRSSKVSRPRISNGSDP
jgi:hypothetical protein